MKPDPDPEPESISVFDVATYILENYRSLTKDPELCPRLKLHKLLYYSQAWALVLDEPPIPLFQEKILAWGTAGVCVLEIFEYMKKEPVGEFIPVSHLSKGDSERVPENRRHTLNQIIQQYGAIEPALLTAMVKSEDPWRKARKLAGLESSDERGNQEISLRDMRMFYSNLQASQIQIPDGFSVGDFHQQSKNIHKISLHKLFAEWMKQENIQDSEMITEERIQEFLAYTDRRLKKFVQGILDIQS